MGKVINWTNEELEILYSNYGKIKITELEKLLYKRNRSGIYSIAKKLKLKGNPALASTKYYFNKDYFNKPNIENCYWAGFIAADGCLSKDGNIKLHNSSKDESLLQTFACHIEYNGPIKQTTDKYNKTYSRLDVWAAYEWHIKLKEIWSITERKSNTLEPPKLKNMNHIYSFIMGYIDGDGSSYYSKTGNYCLSICGTNNMMEWIIKCLETLYLDNEIYNKFKTPNISLNGISQINKQIKYYGHRAKFVRSELIRLLPEITWKLERKWYN